ncbi:MAG: glutathione S-transferase family protein [Alphaproteobacteria bacterium]|mgnify:CR=1 FL=1|jgi:glutathione S-transferase|nr:glutathione S-transferase family protein [Rhodospirillaceae bacterium]MBT6206070.1 glutathione S-transferase family protein [Rhodospirillaceae bacterium]MBT6511530.1 glutathione S-transferase family protein [Rhodospirillaceae bacterium]MBT7614816.1 glutathione S-transferase family protein [Rhodospirillaceae bacterium]MDG2480731.1 glutathione S-transferase family protein [Alphaproteobacteria bacterium]
MRELFHVPLSPFCRKVRIVLKEKGLPFALKTENVWERREEFLVMNPAAKVPVLVEADGTVLADSTAIVEYLQEVQPQPDLLGGNPAQRAETRRLVAWFDEKMYLEATQNIFGEKVQKRFLGQGEPDSATVRAGLANIRVHLDYIAWLVERRTWLAGNNFSLADVAAAAQFSCIDYIGDVPWSHQEAARDWYARVKSRPSFQSLLDDRLPGLRPVSHYDDLDF